jgi:glucokinase
MPILLAGDIGGTKTILRLVSADVSTETEEYPPQTTLHEQTYPSAEYPDLVPIVHKFITEAGEKLGEIPTLEKACFGIAGPVVNNTSDLTNLGWFLSAPELEQNLQIPHVSLINDFAAVGYGVLGLSPDDIYTLQPGKPQPNLPIAVIGAGTGLGQGFLIRHGNAYHTYPSEGGHTDFAPCSELEFQLLRDIKNRGNLDRVSVERVVSGRGIVSIYQFLREQENTEESPQLREIYHQWEREKGHQEKMIDLGAEISKAAITEGDYICQKTLEIFIKAYGAEAGNLALKLLPYGGMYIAGGIAAKNLSLMKDGKFLRAFLQKGRVSPLLEQVPLYLVLNPKVGLIGAALYAARL